MKRPASPYESEAPRFNHLYASGPMVRTVARGLCTLTWVIAAEIVWDIRFNPQWTRFYK